MTTYTLRNDSPIEAQIRDLMDQGAGKGDEVTVTGVVDFHEALAMADEDFDLQVEDVLHDELIGIGVAEGPMFSYVRVVSDTELEIKYTTGLGDIIYELEN